MNEKSFHYNNQFPSMEFLINSKTKKNIVCFPFFELGFSGSEKNTDSFFDLMSIGKIPKHWRRHE